VAYENEDHDLIFLDYTFMEEGAANLIVTEGFQAEDILINDYEGTLFMPDDPQDMSSCSRSPHRPPPGKESGLL